MEKREKKYRGEKVGGGGGGRILIDS